MVSRNQALYHERMLQVEQQHLWQRYHELNQLAQKGGVVFVGDSLVEYAPVTELLSTKVPLYNRGVHGITSQDLLEHLDEAVFELAPSIVFLWIGINDLRETSPEESFARLKVLVETIKTKLPETIIYVQMILPINFETFPRSSTGRNQLTIQQLNQDLQTLSCQLLPVPEELYDVFGQLKQELSLDGLHLKVAGYLPLMRQFQSVLEIGRAHV